MPTTRLRVYHGPDTSGTAVEGKNRFSHAESVTRPASEIIPLLADAYASRRTWLEDFADDEVSIPADLYEVLVAYRFFNRPA